MSIINSPWPGAVIALVGFAAAFVVSGLVAWAGPIDPPTARGAHGRPTPTSGGVAIMGAVGLGLVFVAIFGHAHPDLLPKTFGGRTAMMKVAATLALALVMGAIGALDDLLDLGAGTKLLLQAALALVFATFVAQVETLPLGLGLNLPLGPIIGILGVALWIVVATNAVNFMDGANGLAPGAQVVMFIALMGAAFVHHPILAETAALACSACAGFLPWNVRGRLFQGDAGALFCGFLYAALSILLTTRPEVSDEPAASLYFGPLVLLPFLTDVLLTLAVRARRGQSLLQAHRDHLYQLWLRQAKRPTHVDLAWRIMLIIGGYGGLALWMLSLAPRYQPLVFAFAVVFSTLSWIVLRRRLEREFTPPG
jgi:UDP-GlcNAc:undecaprenyl-phosphate GlcNAc-1-phosphate transferase